MVGVRVSLKLADSWDFFREGYNGARSKSF